MSKKFLVPIDHSYLEALSFRFQNLPAAPGTTGGGITYFNSATNVIEYHNGTAWINPQSRANHSGTQLANTISDFSTAAQTAAISLKLNQFAAPTAAVAMNNQKITGLAAGSAGSTDAVRMVDMESAIATAVVNSAAGIDSKASVRVVAVNNITLTGVQTIDGISVVAGDRVLVRGQTTAATNGVYVCAVAAWTRAVDADLSSEITSGAFWFVEEGTTYGKSQWRVENTGAIVLGTTSININQYGQQLAYVAGNGLSLTGNTFDVVGGYGLLSTGPNVAVDKTLIASKYSATIGTGALTSIVVTHNLNTKDVQISVREVATDDFVECDMKATSVNTCTLAFAVAPASNALRVTVIG